MQGLIHDRLLQVTGLGALVVTPIVGNLSDRYGRKALMTLPVTMSIVPLCKWSLQGMIWPSFSDEIHAVPVPLLRFLGRFTFAFASAVVLACDRSEVYFYVYYVAKIVAGIFCEGTMHCLCFAYVVRTPN
jgi:MFS family permease